MSELQEQICRILRGRFHCLCGRPPYCTCVSDLFCLVLEQCEEEEETEDDILQSPPFGKGRLHNEIEGQFVLPRKAGKGRSTSARVAPQPPKNGGSAE